MDEKMKKIYQAICCIGFEENLKPEVMKKLIKSYMFKEYIESEGFNIGKYKQLLELNQDVLGSLSILLKGYPQFLLSTRVNYNELHSARINGANGFVEKDELFVPKSLEADDHFFGGYLPKVPYIRHWYEYPAISQNFCEYDVTISNGISKEDQFDLILHSDMDLFLGDVLDMSDENYQENKKQLLMKLLQMRDSCTGLNISDEYDHKLGKEYILLSRKK